jgi:Photosynthesis system II assembly factor YCF48
MSRPSAIAPVVMITALAAFAIVLGLSGVARADGAFPESFQLLAPADHAQQLALGTNFGMFQSDDDGATWTWTCEQMQTSMATLYNVGPPPLDRFFSLSPLVGLAYSDDGSCTWKSATGTITSLVARDYFADPTNALHVLALAEPLLGTPGELLPSLDGGATFGAPLFTAPAGAALASVEISRSDSQTIYVAMYATPGTHPSLVRSTDGGVTWTTIDLEAMLGVNPFLIIAVDPLDAKTLTLRVVEPAGESIAVSHDGGTTFTKTLTEAGVTFSAYTRLDDGTELLGGVMGTVGVGYRSTDGGTTWSPWTTTPALHLRALASRGGKIYAAAKNYSDDFAVGVSTDGGATFKKLMYYDEVKSIRACAQQACVDSCTYQASQAIWDKALCDAPDMTTPPVTKSSGCALAGSSPGAAKLKMAAVGVLGLAALCALARRRRRR